MACSINITSVVPIFTSGASVTNEINVTFIAKDCKQVQIEVECGSLSPANSIIFDITSSDTNTVSVPVACGCGDKSVVRVSCTQNPNCYTESAVSLDCIECPDVTLSAEVAGVSSEDDVSLRECNLNGTVTVTLKADITPPQGVTQIFSRWEYSPGVYGDVMDSLSHTSTYDYQTPSDYTAKLRLIGYDDCQQASVKIGTLSKCPCPSITNVQIITQDGCDVVLEVFLNTIGVNCELYWVFELTGETFTTTSNFTSHSYASGGKKVGAVTMICGECVDTRPFELIIDSCSGGGDNGDDDSEVDWLDWCKFARWIMIISAIIAIVSASLITCIPAAAEGLAWVAGVFAVISVASGIYWKSCPNKPCKWGLLFFWQIALGSGLLLSHFYNCCITLSYLGGALTVLGIGFMLKWKKDCHISRCSLYAELLVIMTAVVLPVIAWIEVVPVIKACVYTPVGAVVAVAAGIVGIVVANCAGNKI